MISQSDDGLVCIYDCLQNYKPLRSISVDIKFDYVYSCFNEIGNCFGVLGVVGNAIQVWDSQTVKKMIVLKSKAG